MNEKEIKALNNLAKQLKNKITKERALSSLIEAGILTDKGNFTKPYHTLNNIILEVNR